MEDVKLELLEKNIGYEYQKTGKYNFGDIYKNFRKYLKKQ